MENVINIFAMTMLAFQRSRSCALGRNSLSTFATLIALSTTITCWAQNDFVDLRSVRVPLRNPSDLRSSATVRTVATGVSTASTSTGSSQPPKLYLMQYKEGTAFALRDTLQAGGGVIVDLLSKTAVLVRGTPDVVVAVASLHGALLAEYGADAKVSPETSKVLDLAAPARRRRNQRRALAEMSDTETADSGSADTSIADRVNDRQLSSSSSTSAILRSLQTWRRFSRAQGKSTSSSRTTGQSDSSRSGTSSNGPELFGISVRLVLGLSNAELLVVSQDWENLLAEQLLHPRLQDACRPRLVLDGINNAAAPFLHVFCCEEDLEDAVLWLTSRGQTMWTEPLLQLTLSNAAAGLTVQTGNLNITQYRNLLAFGPRPFWNASIQGDGIIVGVTDTGLDMSQCYFIDDAYRPGSLRTLFTGNPPRLSLPSHRKVVQYMLREAQGVRGFGDELNGHGSHMVGSIAGSIRRPGSSSGYVSDEGTGAAPNARISFFGGSIPNENVFDVPQPVDDKVLSYHYGVGARIGSDSWGHSSVFGVAYTMISSQFDAFAWRNPDWISVTAAGNFGHDNMVSIVSPSTAKNVISVGASINYPRDTTDGKYNVLQLFRYRTTTTTVQDFTVYPRSGSSSFAWRNLLLNKEVPVRMADPETACTPLVGNYTGTVVLVDQNAQPCTNETAYANVANSAAAAVIFIVEKELFLHELTTWMPLSETLTYGYVSRAQGLNMRNVFRTATNITNPILTYITFPNNTRANLGIDSLTFFSSFGPLADGRIKPDLVAPGGPVKSAMGDNMGASATSYTCNSQTAFLDGTSPATAVVSGHLALMRQYFRDGFYPVGASGNALSAPFEPSGMLLKAAAITGARSLAGGVALATGRVMGAAPDGFQGWGRLDLSGALPLSGRSNPNFQLQVADYGVIYHNETLYLRGIRATGTGPVIATLVWHDYPSSGISARDLVNDLDFGFQINPRNGTAAYNRTRIDSSNNVERIELTTLRARDEVVLVVYGSSVLHSLIASPDAAFPQRWAIAVAGHFTGSLKTVYNPAYMRPARLPSNQMVLWLNSTHCANVNNSGLFPTSVCNNINTTFWFTEETDPVSGGPLYTVRNSTGRCWQVLTNATGSRTVVTFCNPALPNQKFAFFVNPYNSSTYLIAAQPFLGSRNEERRCIKLAGNSVTLQVNCMEDDAGYNFRLVRALLSTPSPPSPQPPVPRMPSPQSPTAQPWYPYPLLFRTDFYPVEGKVNDYDYDYSGDSNVLDSYSNLDIIVSWTFNGTVFQVGVDNYLYFDNRTSVAGAVHGGDNVYRKTMYEEIHWQLGYTPQPATYNVCVVWPSPETPRMLVKMTVFRGFAVANTSKVFDTTIPSSISKCDATSAGFIASYNVTPAVPNMPIRPPSPPTPPRSPPVPPSPPAPSSPPARYPLYPVVFRTDWTVLSGITGRENQLVDLDIVVGFSFWRGQFELGYDFPDAAGGVYGGNNLDAGTNFEFVFWPNGSIPPATTYHICVRWFDAKQPLVNVTLSIYRESLVAVYTRVLDTTFPRTQTCTPTANGYIASYALPNLAPRPPPPTPPPSPPAPSPPPPSCVVDPSNLYGLYFRTQWVSGNTSDMTLYDWDMVVAWTSQGQSYELSPAKRFDGGGVHLGDNMVMPPRANGEVAIWPTGLTGQTPQPAEYYICVRWYQPGSLNVRLTVALGDRTVATANRTWSTTTPFSKSCTPNAIGFIGSYTHNATAANATVASFIVSNAAGWNVAPPPSSRVGSGKDESESGVVGGTDPAVFGVPGASLPSDSSTGSDVTAAPSGATSKGTDMKAMAYGLGIGLGGAGLVAAVVLAVRWRQEKIRVARVVAL